MPVVTCGSASACRPHDLAPLKRGHSRKRVSDGLAVRLKCRIIPKAAPLVGRGVYTRIVIKPLEALLWQRSRRTTGLTC